MALISVAMGGAWGCAFDTGGYDSASRDAAGSTTDAPAPGTPDATPICVPECEGGLETCTPAGCVCAPGMFECAMFGGACDDILSDPKNCGISCADAAGSKCKREEYCSAGECICRPGLTDIGGKCHNTLTNTTYCGPVGGVTMPCDGAMPLCEDGACVATCSIGRADCPDARVEKAGTCVDLLVATRHCGVCGNSCKEDELCVGGICRDYTVTGDCSACPCPRCLDVFAGIGVCCENGTDPICVSALSCP